MELQDTDSAQLQTATGEDALPLAAAAATATAMAGDPEDPEKAAAGRRWASADEFLASLPETKQRPEVYDSQKVWE